MDRLFIDLRAEAPKESITREIGDFAAHRDQREKGIAMRRGGEMQIGAKAWFRQMQGGTPTLEEAQTVAAANLKIAPEKRIYEALGLTRQQARSHFQNAAKKLEKGKRPTGKQAEAFNWLAGSFIWETAFTGDELFDDFVQILLTTKAVGPEHLEALSPCKSFILMYVLSVMHLSRLSFSDGSSAPLRLMVREETNTLGIKANIPISDTAKPVSFSVFVFSTDLDANEHSEYAPVQGDFNSETPLEVAQNGRLVELN